MEKIIFDVEIEPTDELIAKIDEIVKDSIKGSGLNEYLMNRFNYIIDMQGRCPMNLNDDRLIAYAIKNFDKDSLVWGKAFLAADYKIKPFVAKMIRGLMVDKNEYEDYFSEARKVMFQKIADYDPDRAALVTYLSRYIQHEFYEGRNNASRHYSTRIKLAVKAMDALKEADIPINNETIANYINTVTPLSREVSPKEIENAMKYHVSIGEMNENTAFSKEAKNPETVYIEKEYTEGLRHACDSENWAVKAMFEVYKEYYLDNIKNNRELKKNLSMSYIKEEMYKKTGVDFSESRLKSIMSSMSSALERGDYGHKNAKAPTKIKKKVIDTFTIDSQELDELMADVIAAGNNI